MEIKWSYFYFITKCNFHELCTTTVSVWWKPLYKNTWKTRRSSTMKLLGCSCIVHWELYSCSQLVARRGCNTKLADQSCAGLFCNNIIYYYFFFPKSPRGLKEFVICSWLVLHKRLSWDLTYKEAFSSFLSLIAL